MFMLADNNAQESLKNVKQKRILLWFKHEVGVIDENDGTAGAENIFLSDVKFFSRVRDLKLLAGARFTDNDSIIIKSPSFTSIMRLVLALSKIPIVRKIAPIIGLIPQGIYVAHFWISAKLFKPDIIFVYSMPFLALFFPKKTIVFLHNYHELPLFSKYENRYHDSTFFTCSASLRGEYLSNYLNLSNRFKILYNSVDSNSFYSKKKKRSKKIRFLFCGAWHTKKGIIDILLAFLLIPDYIRKKTTLTIASNERLWYEDNPNEERRLELKKIKELIKLAKPKLLNGAPHKKMVHIYNCHDWTIVASKWNEPFGLTALESIYCGVPVLGYHSGALPEILSPHNSILLKNKSPQSLADVIIKIALGKIEVGSPSKSLLTCKNQKMTSRYRYSKIIKMIEDHPKYQ